MALTEHPFEEFEETPSQSTADFRGNILDPGFDLTLRPMRYPLFYEMYQDATQIVQKLNIQIRDSQLCVKR